MRVNRTVVDKFGIWEEKSKGRFPFWKDVWEDIFFITEGKLRKFKGRLRKLGGIKVEK